MCIDRGDDASLRIELHPKTTPKGQQHRTAGRPARGTEPEENTAGVKVTECFVETERGEGAQTRALKQRTRFYPFCDGGKPWIEAELPVVLSPRAQGAIDWLTPESPALCQCW